MEKKIAILGGGVTGVVLAGELSTSPLFEVDLIEKAPVLGGLHRNFTIDNLNYDIGAFVFPVDHSLFKTFPRIKDLCLQIKNQMGSLTPRGTIDKYPCTINGYIRDHGLVNFSYACLDLAYCKFRYWQRDNIPAFIKYYIGKNVYEKSGLKSYIEILYGIRDEEIDIEFATKRLGEVEKAASLKAIIYKLLQSRNTALVEPPTLKEVVVRPTEGFHSMYEVANDVLLSQGVNIFTNCEMKAITRRGEGFEIEFLDSKKYYDRVISTIPIATISRLIGKPLEKDLEYRKLLSMFYRFNGDLGYSDNILHNFTTQGSWKRITTFSKYYGTYEGDDYFVVEITLEKDTQPDISKQQQDFENHVQSRGLFKGELKYQGSLVIPNAYPVYRRDRLHEVIKAKQGLREWGLDLAGRQGEFDYITSYDAAANARNLADKIKADYCS
ncbi:NAD(P)-binding protein [Coleofasciculus chthonoplastes]|uniref:NAD(P)-binding protein n=1 Tax=Coleofasciculus chthonoplastes TaxID=64178 RepID=UPI0032F6D683